MQKSPPPLVDPPVPNRLHNGAGERTDETIGAVLSGWLAEIVNLIPKETRKAVRKTVRKVVRRHGPEIATAIVTGVVTSLLTSSGDPKKKKKKKKKKR